MVQDDNNYVRPNVATTSNMDNNMLNDTNNQLIKNIIHQTIKVKLT